MITHAEVGIGTNYGGTQSDAPATEVRSVPDEATTAKACFQDGTVVPALKTQISPRLGSQQRSQQTHNNGGDFE